MELGHSCSSQTTTQYSCDPFGGIQVLDLNQEPLPQETLHGDQLPQIDKTPSTFNNSTIGQETAYIVSCAQMILFQDH